MYYFIRLLIQVILLCACLSEAVLAEEQIKVPILVYHRFGPTVKDGMTLKTAEFASQLQWLKENSYTVIPLKTVVSYLRGEGPPPPAKSVVITADDGHKSVFTDMLPLIRKYNIPVTLFIYPSAISHTSYSMTWEQLQELQKTGLFDIQGHTYWHPNFKKDRKRLKADEYQKFLLLQLSKSKSVIEKKLGGKVELLAWPFGIYDEELEREAGKYGYIAAFSIDARCANKNEKMMAQPRYMIVNGPGIKGFKAIMAGASQGMGTPNKNSHE